MFEITVDTVFAASHQLRMYNAQLEPLHGHNWHVRLTVRGTQLDSIGVVCDFHAVQERLFEICDPLNNTHLNDRPEFKEINPTAENVAWVIARLTQERLGATPKVHRVAVTEAPGCEAAWIADD